MQRNFTCGITAVYISPQANTKVALSELYKIINQQDLGDLNLARLKQIFPKYYQPVSFPTKGSAVLDHVYTNIRDAYKAFHRPTSANQITSLGSYSLPTSSNSREPPTQIIVRCWTEEADSMLQDCLENTEWNMFKDSSTQDSSINIEEYTLSVIGFIRKCVDDVPILKPKTLDERRYPYNAESLYCSIQCQQSELRLRKAKRQTQS